MGDRALGLVLSGGRVPVQFPFSTARVHLGRWPPGHHRLHLHRLHRQAAPRAARQGRAYLRLIAGVRRNAADSQLYPIINELLLREGRERGGNESLSRWASLRAGWWGRGAQDMNM